MPLPFLTFFLPMILMSLFVLPLALPFALVSLIRNPQILQDAWQRIQEILQTTDWQALWAFLQEIFADLFSNI